MGSSFRERSRTEKRARMRAPGYGGSRDRRDEKSFRSNQKAAFIIDAFSPPPLSHPPSTCSQPPRTPAPPHSLPHPMPE